eukprot:s2221_g9.t1
MDPQPARPTVRSYRQQRQMQGGEAAETGAAPTTAPPTAPWSSQQPAADATTTSPAPTGSASRGGYGSRRNQSAASGAPASPAPGGQAEVSSLGVPQIMT